ncbi:hypothetical protein DUI87_25796 [Hirundo rustica rustica]|uniref:Uncharacterized protein n=1 Tax=Hirundo rustica rustica TaxID=333673 RepID=A0A3M0J9M6_HIRRU|nr:hypothetical protein DUI87_25796 [Hirundo rustica rustica]
MSAALPRPQGDPLTGLTMDELMGQGPFHRIEAQLLEALLAVVATLGELAAPVTAPRQDQVAARVPKVPALSPEQIHRDRRAEKPKVGGAWRDLLEQLEARIIFKNGEMSLEGYKNSPTIFGEQLAKDLESWEPPPGEGQLLQYVDDLLRATRTQETCVDWTEQGIALGILAQNLGPYQRAVAYLSKQLDTAAKGWPSGSTGEPVIHECLETIEATYSSRQDLKDTPLEDAETCLLMEAAMSSVEEDMLDPDPECCDKCLSKCLEFRLKIEGCVIRGSDIDFNITQGCTEFHKNQTKITPPVPRKAVITQIPTIPEVEEQVTPVVTKIKP